MALRGALFCCWGFAAGAAAAMPSPFFFSAEALILQAQSVLHELEAKAGSGAG